MYLGSERTPGWYKDAKWLSAIALVISLAATILFVSLSQITQQEPAEQMLQQVLSLTLTPEGDDAGGQLATLRQGLDHQPGEPVQLISSVNVLIPESDVNGLGTEAAREGIVGVLVEGFIDEGREGILERITAGDLRQQLSAALDGPLKRVSQTQLESTMLPSGLTDGSRLANWQQQLSNNPGQPVQPIVGIFVRLEPSEVQQLSNPALGARIVQELNEIAFSEGLAAAQAQISNQNLLDRFNEAFEERTLPLLRDFVATLLMPQAAEIETRLQRVRERLAAAEEGTPVIEGIDVFASAEELEGLSAQEANQRAILELSRVVYTRGVNGVLELASEPAQSQRLERTLTPVSIFTASEQRRFARLSWLLGTLSVILIALLMTFSSGLTRLFNLGLVFVFASLLGVGVLTPLYRLTQRDEPVSMPAGLSEEGTFGYLFGVLEYVVVTLPNNMLTLLLRNHLAVMAVGGVLIALYALISVFKLLRPRRAF